MGETRVEGRRRRNAVIGVVALGLLILAAWGLWFAGSAGVLPWQPEPTRIAITPFADLPTRSAGTPAP